jgi:hypothetical protein
MKAHVWIVEWQVKGDERWRWSKDGDYHATKKSALNNARRWRTVVGPLIKYRVVKYIREES